MTTHFDSMKSILSRLKISIPIIQAPMAGITTPELVAAVSNAGGLGALGAGYMTAKQLRKSIQTIHEQTNKPFSVNLFIPGQYHATALQIQKAKAAVNASCQELNFKLDAISLPSPSLFDKQMEVICEEKVPIFSFTFGIPEIKWIERLKKNNRVLIGTATNLKEAMLLEAAGIDMVVAQGSEAGGHRGTFLKPREESMIPILTLIPQLVKQLQIPVIGAGGIMDASHIVSALRLGAVAVQMGTAFLCCDESSAHPSYKEALLKLKHDNTTLTRAFSGKWARGIANTFITRMQSKEKDILDYPLQHALTTPMRQEASKQNRIEFMSMWAGQSAHLCKQLPAADLLNILNKEASALLEC